ncbi:MAG: redox-regulated ATPase YchF, partial [Angelakisella sp.]
KGEGLGNKFLSTIREVDAVIHVVRCFEDADIIHVDGEIGPRRDIETIELELILSDLDLIDRRIDRCLKSAKSGDKSLLSEAELFKQLKAHLEQGKSARSFPCGEGEKEIISTVPLLSGKPVIYAANMNEADFAGDIDSNKNYLEVVEIAKTEGAEVIPVCGRMEEEIAELSPEDKLMFLDELGLKKSGLDRLVAASYELLGLISYLTAGKPEVRAWTITKGTKAPQAAGKIHSDFERGFIRAEVVAFEELMACGTMAAAKEKGQVRSEGKDYVMKDGDIVLFRFNV